MTSQMFLYFGKEGFNSNTPLRKRHTIGWAPKEELLGNVTIDETALLAVLIALYPMPESYSPARKLIPSSTEGQMGSTPLELQ